MYESPLSVIHGGKSTTKISFQVNVADGALGVSILFLLEANPFASRDNLLVWGGGKVKM